MRIAFLEIYIHSILILSDILFVKLFALHLCEIIEGPPCPEVVVEL